MLTRALLAALFLPACGPSIPTRYVIERDLGDLAYRRYQRVLDVEMPMQDNPAEGHTAVYLRRDRRGEEIAIATAFVTVYEQPARLAAHVREAVEGLASYESEVVRTSRNYVWQLDDGSVPVLLWVSGRHLVKISGEDEEGEIPEDLVDEYLDTYPSDLDEHGAARSGAESAGEVGLDAEETEEDEMPASLREGAPR